MMEMSRRSALGLTLSIGLGAVGGAMAGSDPDLTREAILNDPQAPVGGNRQGDVTIVTFFDYNCIYCMKAHPELMKLLERDAGIRVVYKDWPIFGDMSVYAARLALAAKQQGKYLAIHNALLVTGRKKSTAEQVRDIARDTGIDLKKLDADLASHAQEIDALLKRNDKQAVGMGFEGTPVFLIGPFRVASTLDLAGFEQVVKDARERQTR